MTEGRAMLEYHAEKSVRVESIKSMGSIALTDDEFVILFGTSDPTAATKISRFASPKAVVEFEELPEAKAMRVRLEAALSTTLSEAAQRNAWKTTPNIRVAAQVALFRDSDAAQCLSAVVGGMVRADERRVDDLKTCVEDETLDIMILSQAITALAMTVGS